MKKKILYLVLPIVFAVSFGIAKAEFLIQDQQYGGYSSTVFTTQYQQPVGYNYNLTKVCGYRIDTGTSTYTITLRFVDYLTSSITPVATTTINLTGSGINCSENFNYIMTQPLTVGYYDITAYIGTFQIGQYAPSWNQWYADQNVLDNSAEINFIFPTSTTPLTRDFSNWHLNVSSTSGGKIYVYYGDYDAATLTKYDWVSYSPFVSINPVLISKSNLLWHPPLIATTTHWIANAYLFLGNTILASSTIDFYINPTATSVPYSVIPKLIQDKIGFDPLTLSTSTTFITETCADFEFFSSSTLSSIACHARNFIKDIGNSSNDIATSFVETLTNVIKRVFPISVFNHTKEIFDQVQPSDAPDIILSSTNPAVFGGHSYTIFTSTTIETASQNVGLDYRDLFSKIMYAGTGILILLQTLLVIKLLKNEKRNNV